MVYFDAGVNSAVSDSILGFKSDVLEQFNVVLPLAIAIMISITAVFMAIKWFMRLINNRYVETFNEGFDEGIREATHHPSDWGLEYPDDYDDYVERDDYD